MKYLRKILLKNYCIFFACSLLFISCKKDEETIENTNSNVGACFIGNMGSLGPLTKTSNNPNLDAVMNGEYNNLVTRFGVKPDAYYYTESNGSPNAYFHPMVSNQQLPDGTIAMGFNLLRNEFASSTSGTGITIAIIMAHEFAHCVDFKYNVYDKNNRTKHSELFADYMAGCYLHLKSLTIGEQYLQEVATAFYNRGDYSFNDPYSHGTPDQRRSCIIAGYNFSKTRVQSGINYSVNDAISNAKVFVAQIP
jgi:hypothetical protein